jgi:hypothetical protein
MSTAPLLKRGQEVPHSDSGMKHSRLDRPNRAIGHKRHLLDGMSQLVSQRKTQAMAFGQVTQSLVKPLALLELPMRVNDTLRCWSGDKVALHDAWLSTNVT